MDFLPLFHNLKGRTVLVVGGGEIALRKARLLSEAGAVLRVVAPEVAAELSELVAEGGGQTLHRGYLHSDLSGCVLAIAATDDEPLNAQVSEDAKALGMPVSVVDSPQLCTVIFPAIVDRSPLMIAVSSGGDAPVLARLMRARIETWVPSVYGQTGQLAINLGTLGLWRAGRSGEKIPRAGQSEVRQRATASCVLGGGLPRRCR